MKRYLYTSLGSSVKMLCMLLLVIPTALFAQPGKNGPLTVSTTNVVVNCYSAVTSNVSSGSTTIITDNSCTLECGDLVMVYQAQGASINTTNTDQYGLLTSYNNSGLYEFNYVVSSSGGTVTVQSPWVNNYTASGKVQLIKVPQYTTLTVNAGASIVPSQWQDVAGGFRKGGVVAIHATGTVTVNGTIQANACSFRSGVVEQNTSSAGGPVVTDFVTTSSSLGAEKGESIAGFGPEYDGMGGRFGRGSAANGGGGGNGHNAGGGGGANGNNGNAYNGQGVMCLICAGTLAWLLDPYVIANGLLPTNSSGGGRGGYTYGSSNQDALNLSPSQTAWGGDRRRNVGGYGGHPLTITPGTRIFFGGGGGIGDSNNSGNAPGGKGGGLVYIIAPTVTGNGIISANGQNAINQIATSNGAANDAPSGGGGGGSIVIKSTVSNSLTLSANGGKGGDQGFLANESEGPGGGGGGGFIAITAGTPTQSVQGGANGITLSGSLTEFTANGSTSGSSGQTQTIPAGFITYVPVNITATGTTPVCAGNAINFTSTVNFSGGTFAWSGPGGFTATTQNPTIASATMAHNGQFTVIYTSPGGCKDTAFVTIVVNPTPVVNTTVVNPLCNAACNGSAAINFTTPGTPAYTYAWNNGQTTQTASNLCAGTYTATITDSKGCTATTTATITNPPVLTATAAVVNISCNGACTGTITVTASGGTGVKQYSLNGGAFQASNVFTGLCVSNNTITVKDANGCTVTVSANITQAPALTGTLVSTSSATCGTNSGGITVSAAGGTTPYSYSIGGPGQASPVFTNLSAGTYTVTITDASGCTTTVPATVTSSNSPTATILSQQNVSCFGGLNGSVLIGATGGTPAFHYSLNGGPSQLSNSFSSLSTGSYVVTVSDANGCTSVVNFTITSPTQLTYTSAPTPTSCNGLCNGSILITPTGGTSPFQYSGNNGTSFSSTNPIPNLCAGAVNVVVKDANGCLANSVVTITQPTPLTATYVNTDPLCNDGCNGQIAVTAAGGTPAYQYKVNGGAFQTSPTLTGLCPGNQNVIVKDNNGCQITTVRNLANPPAIAITLNSMIESNCGFNNGSLDVSASGLHPPFQYSINGSPNQPTGVFTNLLAGAYTITATDALGCQESIFFGVNDIEMDGVLLTQTDVSCFGGTDGGVEVTNVSGAPPITYELDNSGVTQTNGSFYGLSEGSHIVTIYDNGFCIFTIPFNTIQPAEITFGTTVANNSCNAGATGAITFTGTAGGVGSYQFSVDNGSTFQTGATFNGLPAGMYNLAVTDANGCIVNGTADIAEPTPVQFVQNVFDLNCNGDNSGFIQIVASGGTGSYEYSIDNGTTFSVTPDFSGLAAGSYAAVVRDANLCQATGTIVVTEPPLLTATYASTPTLCNNSCDGQFTITASGGTGTYQYSTDGGTTFGISSTITGLCSANYTLIVKDQHSCSISATQTITAPPALTLAAVPTSSTCSQPNGALQLTASGGTGSYLYSNDNGTTFGASNMFTGLSAANYISIVQDANSCQASITTTITDQSAPVIASVFVTSPSCNGLCNGQISVTANGGVDPLSYSIGGASQASGLFTGICAGTYTITITDQNGCTATSSAVVTDPPALAFTSTGVDLTCYQNSTGMIQVDATGGTAPYSYSFDNGSTFTASPDAIYIASGTYFIVVSDANSCLATGQKTLNEPTSLVSAVSVTNTTCNTSCDGTATVNVSGGTSGAGYTYTWSSAVTNTNLNQATNLCQGSYSVTATDQNGCQISNNFHIFSPAVAAVNSVIPVEPSCNGLCDGSVTVNSTGGVSFSFDNGATFGPSNVLTNACAGVYNIKVINAVGCQVTSSVTLNEPTLLQLFSTPDSLMCSADTIPLFAIAVGGTAPYTYNWSNSVANQTQDVHPSSPTTYTVTATDANGCPSPVSTTNLTMLSPLTISISSDTVLCQGSSVVLNTGILSGSPAYSYQWSSNVNDTLSSVTVTPTAPTTYTVSVTDLCMTVDTTVFVDFYAVPQMSFSSDLQVGCSPLTVTFTPNIDPALLGNCSWQFSNGQTVVGCTNVTATFTVPGCYDLQYTGTTAEGCPMTGTFAAVACVNPDPVANFSYNPTDPTVIDNTVNFVNHSINDVSRVWTFGNYGTSTIDNPHVYFENADPNELVLICLEVTSADGCKNEICKQIKIKDDFELYVPNAFTPDGDRHNNVFLPVLPKGAAINEYSLLIFDRWGEIIFESLDYQAGWDGTYHDNLVQDGVYTWVIELKGGPKNASKKYIGHVTILR